MASTHTKACRKSVPHGVIRRLSLLTSKLPENENLTIEKLYPDHAEALNKAGLLASNFSFPTLKDSLMKIEKSVQKKKAISDDPKKAARDKKRAGDQARRTWFVIGFSNVWDVPVGRRITELCKRFNMTWLRVRVSYRVFPNIGQKFNGDVNNKVMRNVYAQGFENKKCTCCQKSKLEDGKCRYEGFCQRSSLVYELVCTTTGKSYIGKTQRYLRKRTQEHVDTVWKQIEWENGVKKD